MESHQADNNRATVAARLCAHCNDRPATVWCEACCQVGCSHQTNGSVISPPRRECAVCMTAVISLLSLCRCVVTVVQPLCAPNGCDAELHAVKVRAHHVREPFPVVIAGSAPEHAADAVPVAAAAAPTPATAVAATAAAAAAVVSMCACCHSHVASVHCVECAQDLCQPGCDEVVHARTDKAMHTRTPLSAAPAAVAATAAAIAASPSASFSFDPFPSILRASSSSSLRSQSREKLKKTIAAFCTFWGQ